MSGLPGTDTKTDGGNPDADPASSNHSSYQDPEHNSRIPDLNPEWGPAHTEFDNGLLDGYVAVSGKRALSYYTGRSAFHWLAKTFASSDRHFSPLIGPTWPNRLFFFKAPRAVMEDISTNEGGDHEVWRSGGLDFHSLEGQGRLVQSI